jgi:hypothetical protein
VIELKALQQQVRALEADLNPTGRADPALRQEWEQARTAQRTAATFETWLGDRVTQVAVSWVLGSVFVRFAEDNGLIEYPYIAGPGERTAQARELQAAYYGRHPERDDYDWLTESFTAMSVSPVAAGLFNADHNPMWRIKPTPFAVKALLDFWRQADQSGALRYDLTDATWNTRFLGDLYQDLSEHAKKTYALLQTPVFVEEFILDYTLDPAIEEFGLDGLRTIDPACGSGHFLLGAFQRVLTRWQEAEPAADNWTLIARTLGSVHGVDKNPFAAAIARFRLMLAAMQSAGITRLTVKVDFPLNIAVGDSLLHGKGAPGIQSEFEFEAEKPAHTYRIEDVSDYIKSVGILESGSYHAIFGNPPYVNVGDKREDANYRKAYLSCYKEYSLAVPFAERFFKLAIPGASTGYRAGYVGQITANSFMKREFGKKLIGEFFPLVDLTHVIDTSGAYIPAHGTPTVILFGRRRHPRSSVVRTVRSVNGEPSIPEDPASGHVWDQIVSQIRNPGFDGKWVSVGDLARGRYFARHPWILEAGGLELVEFIQKSGVRSLATLTYRVGYFGDSHADQAFIFPAIRRFKEIASEIFATGFHRGQQIRNWSEESREMAVLPYDDKKVLLSKESLTATFLRFFWPLRTELWNRADFTGKNYADAGRNWWEWHQLPRDIAGHEWVIAFSDLATHNHFAFDARRDAYNRHAPIIRLGLDAVKEDYLELLALLNSSMTCFWLKRVNQDKGNGGIGGGIGDEAWEPRYEFTGANLQRLPLTSELPLEFGRSLDALAGHLAAVEPSALAIEAIPTRARLDAARAEYDQIRGRMIALQEELDWDVYRRYGLLDDQEAVDLIADPAAVQEVHLGERAFEIIMARRMEAGELDTQWFVRHRATPISEIPKDWPENYRRVVEKRIEIIARDRNIGLIERPECKRRWQSDPWEDKEREALTIWLLDRCEDRVLWSGPDGQPRPMTVNRLADRLRENPDVVAVARLLAGQDADLSDVLSKILADEHVPYLAQLRYKAEGLLKRAQWEQTWNLQRQEDKTDSRLDIPVPPKYTGADFHKPSFWRHRGKLDVPKERFISYPGASPDADPSLLLGWGGWDHREQAAALITLIEDRTATDGWDTGRVTPLIAGLAEVMPWVRQWHHEIDPAFGQSPADAYDAYLTSQRETHHLTDAALASWKPSAAPRAPRRA